MYNLTMIYLILGSLIVLITLMARTDDSPWGKAEHHLDTMCRCIIVIAFFVLVWPFLFIATAIAKLRRGVSS